jgi:hypothetical protein
MATVLVASIGLAALHAASPAWAGAMLLLTHGILALAAVGAACRRGAGRAWWLGFLLFGMGYLYVSSHATHLLPTIRLLEVIASSVGSPAPPANPPAGGFVLGRDVSQFEEVGHCLWSLLAATLGAYLARALFGAGDVPREEGAEDRPRPNREAISGRRRLAAILLLGLILFAAIAAAGPRARPGLWSGSIFFLTWGLLGLVALGAVFGRGRGRAAWAGAALFGVAYMLLIFGSDLYGIGSPHAIGDALVHDLGVSLPPIARGSLADRAGVVAANERVLGALDQVVPMNYPEETPLEDVLRSIQLAARCADGRGIPIYVDPVGLAEAEKTPTSPVQIELDGVPLSTSLRLALRPMGLMYYVKDGLLEITSEGCYDPPFGSEDAYLVVGHCLLAVVAAMLGACLAPLVAGEAR